MSLSLLRHWPRSGGAGLCYGRVDSPCGSRFEAEAADLTKAELIALADEQ